MSNRSFTVLASGTVAASGNSSDYSNSYHKGATVVAKVGAGSGTSPTLTVKIQGKTAAGDYYDVPSVVTAALAAASGVTTLTVYPGVAETANVSVSDILPRTWRVVWTLGGSSTPSLADTSISAVLHS